MKNLNVTRWDKLTNSLNNLKRKILRIYLLDNLFTIFLKISAYTCSKHVEYG